MPLAIGFEHLKATTEVNTTSALSRNTALLSPGYLHALPLGEEPLAVDAVEVLAMVTVHTFLNPQMRASSLQTGSIVAHSPNCVWVTIHFFLSTQS